MFVYGSLKPGESRWPSLAEFCDPAYAPHFDEVDGQLWDTGYGWPALTSGDARVPGVVVTLRSERVDDALGRLDEIEGVDRGLFERIEVKTRSGERCWTYRWPAGTDGFTPVDGVWSR